MPNRFTTAARNHSLAFVAGACAMTAACVASAASAAFVFSAGVFVALCVVAGVARLLGAGRLARMFAAIAAEPVKAPAAKPARRLAALTEGQPGKPPVAAVAPFTAAESDVVSALVNLGVAKKLAGQAVASIRGRGLDQFEGIFRAALDATKPGKAAA
jgi:hypothetical protein